MVTQEDVDALYAAMLRQKKGSRAYWEARCGYEEAQGLVWHYQLISLRDELKDTPLAVVVQERDVAQHDLKTLKDEIRDDNEEHEAKLADKDVEIEAARDELAALYTAFGMSDLDYQLARDHGRLPNGKLLNP